MHQNMQQAGAHRQATPHIDDQAHTSSQEQTAHTTSMRQATGKNTPSQAGSLTQADSNTQRRIMHTSTHKKLSTSRDCNMSRQEHTQAARSRQHKQEVDPNSMQTCNMCRHAT